MDDQDMVYYLMAALMAGEVEVETRTFYDAGLLTRNAGLVARFPNGLAFQITVVADERNIHGDPDETYEFEVSDDYC